MEAVKIAKATGALISFDVNYRKGLWPESQAAATLTPLMEMADLLFMTREDAVDLFGLDGSPEGIVKAAYRRYQPRICVVTLGDEGGIGNTLFSGFLSPIGGDITWGVGPIAMLPTNTDDRLGTDEFGLGPTGVVLATEGPWVYGALVQNVWGLESRSNSFLTQPFGKEILEWSFRQASQRALRFRHRSRSSVTTM